MNSQIGRAGFHIAFYIFFIAGILLLFLPKETAEYTITLFTFILGLVFMLIVVLLVRITQRKL